jgi:DnaJ-class molecular chaperone
MKDYYKILNINSNASFNQVIEAYNNMIVYYNSLLILNPEDKENVKEIKEAYFVLGDYHNRRNYDNKREGLNVKNPNKSLTELTSDRVFFRPNLNYNPDLVFKETQSDLDNNRKIRDPLVGKTMYYSKI